MCRHVPTTLVTRVDEFSRVLEGNQPETALQSGEEGEEEA